VKKFKAEELDAAAWRAAFVRVNQAAAEEIPPGWFSPEEIAMKLGHCREVGIQKCRDLAKAGMVERKDFRVVWGRGVRPKPFYRLKPLAAKP
jgi:hypothetical protein